MADPNKVYAVIKLFLQCRGYDATLRCEGKEDGNMILHYLEEAMKGSCYTNENGTCVMPAFDRLFHMMESGQFWNGKELSSGESPWTKGCTECALKVGGYSRDE